MRNSFQARWLRHHEIKILITCFVRVRNVVAEDNSTSFGRLLFPGRQLRKIEDIHQR
jgi:hypothetical protein